MFLVLVDAKMTYEVCPPASTLEFSLCFFSSLPDFAQYYHRFCVTLVLSTKKTYSDKLDHEAAEGGEILHEVNLLGFLPSVND